MGVTDVTDKLINLLKFNKNFYELNLYKVYTKKCNHRLHQLQRHKYSVSKGFTSVTNISYTNLKDNLQKLKGACQHER